MSILEFLNDSKEEHLEILELYYMDGRRKQPLIKELCEIEDWKNYRIEVHGLKSASANIGAMELSEMAKAHEQAAIEENIDFINNGINELLSKYTEVCAEIKAILDENNSGNSDEEKPEIDTADLKGKLELAYELLEDFKSKEALNEVRELMDYKLPDDIHQFVTDAEVELRMYNDDEAEELLKQALGLLD